MTNYKQISNQETLENIINDIFKKVLQENGEHPFAYNAKYMKSDGLIGYIAQDLNKIIGITFLCPFHSKEAYEITTNFNIYILPSYRGKKHGTKLWELLMKAVRQKGNIHNQIISVYQEQQSTIQWLLKNNFSIIGQLDDIDTDVQFHKTILFFMYKVNLL